MLNCKLTVISHIFWKTEFNFTSHTLALLPDLLNQETTKTEQIWQHKVGQKITVTHHALI